MTKTTLKSLDEIAEALRHQDAQKLTEADRSDEPTEERSAPRGKAFTEAEIAAAKARLAARTPEEVEQDKQALREERAKQGRVLTAPASEMTQRQLEAQRNEAAKLEDVAAVVPLIVALADHFGDEIEGRFSERLCTKLIKVMGDTRTWITEQQIPQVLDEMRTLRRPTGEIDTVRLDAKIAYLSRLEREAELYEITCEAAKKAFRTVSGVDYKEAAPRGKAVSRKDAAEDQFAAVMARYGRKAS